MRFSLYANVNKDANGQFLAQVCKYIESIGSVVMHSEIVSKAVRRTFQKLCFPMLSLL